jgi:hypothetical protein
VLFRSIENEIGAIDIDSELVARTETLEVRAEGLAGWVCGV